MGVGEIVVVVMMMVCRGEKGDDEERRREEEGGGRARASTARSQRDSTAAAQTMHEMQSGARLHVKVGENGVGRVAQRQLFATEQQAHVAARQPTALRHLLHERAQRRAGTLLQHQRHGVAGTGQTHKHLHTHTQTNPKKINVSFFVENN